MARKKAGRKRTYLQSPHTKLIKIPNTLRTEILKLAERSGMNEMEYIQQVLIEAAEERVVFELE